MSVCIFIRRLDSGGSRSLFSSASSGSPARSGLAGTGSQVDGEGRFEVDSSTSKREIHDPQAINNRTCIQKKLNIDFFYFHWNPT